MTQAGAAAPAVNRACARVADAGDNGGSVRARSGLGQAETGVQVRARMCKAEALAAQSCRARTLAVAVTAAVEAGNSGRSGDSGLRWEGECEVTK